MKDILLFLLCVVINTNLCGQAEGKTALGIPNLLKIPYSNSIKKAESTKIYNKATDENNTPWIVVASENIEIYGKKETVRIKMRDAFYVLEEKASSLILVKFDARALDESTKKKKFNENAEFVGEVPKNKLIFNNAPLKRESSGLFYRVISGAIGKDVNDKNLDIKISYAPREGATTSESLPKSMEIFYVIKEVDDFLLISESDSEVPRNRKEIVGWVKKAEVKDWSVSIGLSSPCENGSRNIKIYKDIHLKTELLNRSSPCEGYAMNSFCDFFPVLSKLDKQGREDMQNPNPYVYKLAICGMDNCRPYSYEKAIIETPQIVEGYISGKDRGGMDCYLFLEYFPLADLMYSIQKFVENTGTPSEQCASLKAVINSQLTAYGLEPEVINSLGFERSMEVILGATPGCLPKDWSKVNVKSYESCYFSPPEIQELKRLLNNIVKCLKTYKDTTPFLMGGKSYYYVPVNCFIN